MRRLPVGQVPPGPLEYWTCSDNKDPRNNSCESEGSDSTWYDIVDQDLLLAKDPLLKHLSELKKKHTKKDKTVISHVYSHAVFDSNMSCEEELQQLEEQIGSSSKRAKV